MKLGHNQHYVVYTDYFLKEDNNIREVIFKTIEGGTKIDSFKGVQPIYRWMLFNPLYHRWGGCEHPYFMSEFSTMNPEDIVPISKEYAELRTVFI